MLIRPAHDRLMEIKIAVEKGKKKKTKEKKNKEWARKCCAFYIRITLPWVFAGALSYMSADILPISFRDYRTVAESFISDMRFLRPREVLYALWVHLFHESAPEFFRIG